MIGFVSGSRTARRIALLAAALSLAVAAAAGARQPAGAVGAGVNVGEGVEVRLVPTRGLDLAQPEDLKRLHHRIDAAIDGICGAVWNEGLDRRMRLDACREMAARSAAPQVDALVHRDVEYAAARASMRRRG
jgi:UrcA family protein